MDPPRLDYAPPPPRSLRRSVVAFLAGYLIASLICWMLLSMIKDEGPVMPLAVFIGPVWTPIEFRMGLTQKAQLFLILIAGPALWGLYASIAATPSRRRWIWIGAAALLHAAGIALTVMLKKGMFG